jgi:hypothetical protein
MAGMSDASMKFSTIIMCHSDNTPSPGYMVPGAATIISFVSSRICPVSSKSDRYPRGLASRGQIRKPKFFSFEASEYLLKSSVAMKRSMANKLALPYHFQH